MTRVLKVSENATGAAVAAIATAMTFAPVGVGGAAAVRMYEGASVACASSEFSERISAGTSVGKTHQVLVLRNTHSMLLDDPLVAAAVADACRQLRTRLGLLYRFVAEEATNPEDDESEPRLFLSVLVGPDDDRAMAEIDSFILHEWVKQPVQIRQVVRIGGEFV